MQCPLNDSISFEPTSGFRVKTSNRFDPAGTYVCTAGLKGNYQATQYILVAEDSPPRNFPVTIMTDHIYLILHMYHNISLH